MKIKVYLLSALLIPLLFASTFAQATAFSYQGRLTDGGNPATGNFLMQFKLFDASSGGNQIGPTLTDVLVSVNQGVFSARLDFGSNTFTGANRWLEIAVRHNSNEAYVTLAPREQIASSPYSVRTLSAGTADLALDSQKLGGIDASQYVTTTNSGTSFIKNQTTQQASSNFNISGNGIIGGSLGVGLTPLTRIDTLTSGDAIRGISTGGGRGIWGESNTWQGVYGKSSSNAGVVGESTNQYGVFGVSSNVSASGIYGSNNVAGGTGIIGQTISGNGVYGFSTTNGRGVFGQSDSWQGVYGKSNSQAGVAGESASFYGVYGITSGVSASGIYGSNNAAGGTAIIGQSNSGKGVYGSSTGSGGTGVWGEVNTSGSFGVRGVGTAFNTTGVKGESNQGQGIGVWGQGDVNTGVYGLTVSGYGVYGKSTGSGIGIFSEGNAAQSSDKGGFVKALVFVNGDGTLLRCYNGVSGSSVGNCGGITTGRTVNPQGDYIINFPFQINSRFVSLAVQDFPNLSKPVSTSFQITGSNSLEVSVFITGEVGVATDRPVMVIVY